LEDDEEGEAVYVQFGTGQWPRVSGIIVVVVVTVRVLVGCCRSLNFGLASWKWTVQGEGFKGME
jgi:hypothetical protein